MFFFKRKHRKKESAAISVSDDKTCFLSGSGEDDEKTEFWDDRNEDPPDREPKFTIKLTDLKNQNRTWTLQVVDELLFGRAEYCTVQFYDLSVSREQFKIVARGEKLYIVQVGATNRTKRNGVVIEESTMLCSGDILKFGRESLRVDYIETRYPMPDLELGGTYIPCMVSREDEEDTMSFF